MNYGYDSLYRLTAETVSADPHGNNGTGSYTYDNVGNRLTLSSSLPPAGMMNYSYDADDRLGSDQYDPNGNTISSAGTTSTYDFENHLVSKGGVTIVYDGDGNRVCETVAGVTTQYLVDTQNPTGYAQVVDELQNGAVTKTYSYGLERISQNWQPTTGNWQPAFYGYDGHGSVRQLTNSAGAVTDTYDFDAFGNLISSTGSTPNNYLFAGEQYDPALGLYYNRARYLNTATGRFWSMDTYEGLSTSPLSLHKYLYASGNPLNRVDASGNQDTVEEVAAEADSEIVGSAEDEESFAARKALNMRVVDIYECAKWQLYWAPYHSWPYANLPGNQGVRYDIGPNKINGQVLTGPVPGGLYISETKLDTVQQEANSKFSKEASLSFLRFLEWQSLVVGTALFIGETEESILQFEREYNLGPPYLLPEASTQIGDAINCIIFTKLAIAEAKKLQGED